MSLMVLKNKAERESFLKDYHNEEFWESDSYTYTIGNNDIFEVNYYCCEFKNGALVVVTECKLKNERLMPCSPTFDIRYNLIIPESNNYNPFDQHSGRTPKEFMSYNLTGCSIGTIADYMAKRKHGI
jgi:hypothetical protein